MLKKFFSFCGAFALICFSFYYTDNAVDLIRKNDPIMKEIEKASEEYELPPTDAVLTDSYIIPGMSGVKVDFDKSYEKMKGYGEYHSSLLVFEEVAPKVSVEEHYDSYIQKGNQANRKVSLVFTLENTSYFEELIKILGEEKVRATFFLDSSLFSSTDVLRLLLFHSHEIESLGENGTYTTTNLKEAGRRLRNFGKKNLFYCFSLKEDKNTLDTCKNAKLHTIIPSVEHTKYPLTTLKKELENGSIIHVTNDEDTKRELKLMIQYIYQKGYQIVPLEELLKE